MKNFIKFLLLMCIIAASIWTGALIQYHAHTCPECTEYHMPAGWWWYSDGLNMHFYKIEYNDDSTTVEPWNQEGEDI